MNNLQRIFCVSVIFLILFCSVNLYTGKVKFKTEEKFPGCISIEWMKSGKEPILLTFSQGYLQEYKFDGSELKPGIKYNLGGVGNQYVSSRRPVSGSFVTDIGYPRLWVWTNIYQKGMYRDLAGMNPLISLERLQPLAAGYMHNEYSLLLGSFIPGTDIVKGDIEFWSLQSSELSGKKKIPGFYQIINMREQNDKRRMLPSNQWSWMVLHSDGEIVLYDENFNNSMKLNIRTGYIEGGFLSEGRFILLCTSIDTGCEACFDEVLFYSVDLTTGLSEHLSLGIQSKSDIQAICAITFDDDVMICVLTENDIMKIYTIDIDEISEEKE